MAFGPPGRIGVPFPNRAALASSGRRPAWRASRRDPLRHREGDGRPRRTEVVGPDFLVGMAVARGVLGGSARRTRYGRRSADRKLAACRDPRDGDPPGWSGVGDLGKGVSSSCRGNGRPTRVGSRPGSAGGSPGAPHGLRREGRTVYRSRRWASDRRHAQNPIGRNRFGQPALGRGQSRWRVRPNLRPCPRADSPRRPDCSRDVLPQLTTGRRAGTLQFGWWEIAIRARRGGNRPRGATMDHIPWSRSRRGRAPRRPLSPRLAPGATDDAYFGRPHPRRDRRHVPRPPVGMPGSTSIPRPATFVTVVATTAPAASNCSIAAPACRPESRAVVAIVFLVSSSGKPASAARTFSTSGWAGAGVAAAAGPGLPPRGRPPWLLAVGTPATGAAAA